MLRFLTLLFALVASPALSQTIDQLGTGSALTGTEKIPMFQTANPAVTTTPNAIKTFVGAGGVTGVSNSDASLTISPTTGAVIASLNVGHSNTWSAAQTFSSTLTFSGLTTGTQVSCLGLTSGNAVALSTGACGSGAGSGTVTSVAAGCGTSTGGSPITTSGSILSAETITIRTSGNYVTADCGTLVQYNSASDQTPTLPTSAAAGAGLYFDTCSINHAQTITPTGSNTIGGGATYTLATGTTGTPSCVKLVADGNSGVSGDWKVIPMTGSGSSSANPTATAGPTVVNGSASTFMRSDGAPAVQKATSGQFGIVEVDGTSITAASGIISATATGTVTSISAACGGSTSGSPITTTGTISAIETVTVRTSGNYVTGDCGTLVNYNDASDASPTLPQVSAAGAGFFFDTCSIQHSQTLTPFSGDTIGGQSTYLLRTGTAKLPTCVKLIADGTTTWEIIPVQGATQVFVQPIETAATLSGCNGSTATADLTLASYFSCTVSTGAVTFAVSNPAASGLVSSFTLELTNAGSQTLTWMSGTKWPGGSAPTFTTSGVDLVVCSTRDGATTWRCVGSEINSN